MEWLRDLPWGVFWFGWGMVAILAGGSLYAVWWAKRNAKAIGAQTPVNVSDLGAGYRMAWGRTVGPHLTAPLTGRPCVWWKVQVWEAVREKLPGQKTIDIGSARWIWREAVSTESDRPLLFGDGKAVAAVWTWGATAMIPSGWSDWRGQTLPPEDRNPELRQGGTPAQGIRHDSMGTFGPRFRYVEQIIEVDAPIFALGKVTRTDPSLYADDADADGEEEDAYVAEEDDLASEEVDADANEDEGWRAERDRLGLLPTPDSVIAADMARATWTIGAADGQPFLISTEHPDTVSAEQELGAKGGLIMGGIFVFLALFLAWVRLAG
jgi:hypothetical protein